MAKAPPCRKHAAFELEKEIAKTDEQIVEVRKRRAQEEARLRAKRKKTLEAVREIAKSMWLDPRKKDARELLERWAAKVVSWLRLTTFTAAEIAHLHINANGEGEGRLIIDYHCEGRHRPASDFLSLAGKTTGYQLFRMAELEADLQDPNLVDALKQFGLIAKVVAE